MSLKIKSAQECTFDQLSLGEVMLRLDPGEGRIRTTREFKVWEGGGEYNTSRGLRKCFGLKTAVCTAFVDNEVGHLVEDFIMQGGVATDFIKWREDDGIGRTVRNGLNFTERGFGVRGAVGNPDRGNTAVSQLKPGDIDWEHLFGKLGVRWFHTGGIFAALSASTAEVTVEAVKAANRHGTIVSYDLNYRPSLWKTIGGLKKAQEVNREIAQYVDVMIGNEEDFTASLGFEVEGADHNLPRPHRDRRLQADDRQGAVKAFPNFKVAATTLRQVIKRGPRTTGAPSCGTPASSTRAASTWSWRILDRVGGGGSFASGLQFGFPWNSSDAQKAVDYGAAAGARTRPHGGLLLYARKWEKQISGGGAHIVVQLISSDINWICPHRAAVSAEAGLRYYLVSPRFSLKPPALPMREANQNLAPRFRHPAESCPRACARKPAST